MTAWENGEYYSPLCCAERWQLGRLAILKRVCVCTRLRTLASTVIKVGMKAPIEVGWTRMYLDDLTYAFCVGVGHRKETESVLACMIICRIASWNMTYRPQIPVRRTRSPEVRRLNRCLHYLGKLTSPWITRTLITRNPPCQGPIRGPCLVQLNELDGLLFTLIYYTNL